MEFNYYSKESNRNKEKAIKHFKETGEWFPGCVLHHVNPNLKYDNPVRYCEWRIEDLVVMDKKDHVSYHDSLGYGNAGATGMRGRNHTEETKQLLRDINTGKKYSDETKKKQSEMRKGHPVSDETRAKLSDILTGVNTWTKQTTWYTNGVQNVRRMECPEGFWPGRVGWSKKKKEAVNA